MGRRSDHSRDELRELILGEGERVMAEAGFAAFSAREVAKRIGYSIGTIYNVFGSYDGLVLAINARTLNAWADFIEARLGQGAADRIAALVKGYFDFAAENRNRWMALYDHRTGPGGELPDWFVAAFNRLIGTIEAEVATACGTEPGPKVRALTGSLVAIAHGHCMFALNGTHELFGAWTPQEAALTRIREALRPA